VLIAVKLSVALTHQFSCIHVLTVSREYQD
jgi:hypothetical protein